MCKLFACPGPRWAKIVKTATSNGLHWSVRQRSLPLNSLQKSGEEEGEGEGDLLLPRQHSARSDRYLSLLWKLSIGGRGVTEVTPRRSWGWLFGGGGGECRSSSLLPSVATSSACAGKMGRESLNRYACKLVVFISVIGFLWNLFIVFFIFNGDNTTEQKLDLWDDPSSRGYRPCVQPSSNYSRPSEEATRFLVATCNGGLNQMRAGICDMVAVARILNITLVLPELDKKSFWQDDSTFADLFDAEYFIDSLRGDINIVRKLPPGFSKAPRCRKSFRSWAHVWYYETEIVPLLEQCQILRATKTDSRLANNDLPLDIQKLRCRAQFDALRFAKPIRELGETLVRRLRARGPFLALHLRYEKDMLAFSGCNHGLNKSQAEELRQIRLRTAHWSEKEIDSEAERINGRCPLTPEEVSLMLEAMEFPRNTTIYIAAGEIYGGQQKLTPLRQRFPNIIRKNDIATPEELALFRGHGTQLAALDYMVAVESNVFIATYAGHMAQAVEGHRRYNGHRKTITPDRKTLVALFEDYYAQDISFEQLKEMVYLAHLDRQGGPRERFIDTVPGSRGKDRYRSEKPFYANPLPECLCRVPDRQQADFA
ncbi:hypothetical protein CBR_g38891 [Chara braunii]|uniref:O-fucosyltransferase family protein n=1 Tax=Chara braunii TaxID=69332 RepID=A0A388LQJ4_CHABU|nr:hypothetical protein CBR_g38891 [Chara braunii]|eukprot:GBG84608.1 hypothetical protein CBR_g38891 [Chara braunii]